MMTTEAVRLDVRPVLASGGEPLDLIMSTVAAVPAGGTFELTAPFEPIPLYQVMRRRGFVGHAQVQGPGEWLITFRDSGIVPTNTLSEIVSRVPAARTVLALHGLDLCCGGAKTLTFAAEAHGLSLDSLLGELQTAAGKGER